MGANDLRVYHDRVVEIKYNAGHFPPTFVNPASNQPLQYPAVCPPV
jgi:hypothetical protein